MKRVGDSPASGRLIYKAKKKKKDPSHCTDRSGRLIAISHGHPGTS